MSDIDNSKILWNAYNRFFLNIYGKKVPIPYRINIPADPHPRRQGKSSPEDILDQLKKDAFEQSFDLKSASIDEIRDFMQKNNLGIDCSGFAYRILDELIQKVRNTDLRTIVGQHVGATNVKLLTSEKFSDKINLFQIKSGDLIKVNSSKKIPHVLVVIEATPEKIIYAHSSQGGVGGVHTGEITIINPSLPIENQTWNEKFLIKSYGTGDGIYRLKTLSIPS